MSAAAGQVPVSVRRQFLLRRKANILAGLEVAAAGLVLVEDEMEAAGIPFTRASRPASRQPCGTGWPP